MSWFKNPSMSQYTLSFEQASLSSKLLELTNQQRYTHFEAVCGAGKTEIIYETIYDFLKKAKRIAYAIPRTDVVKELTIRFMKVFPNTIIKPLYSNSHDDENAQMLVTTIHQLIHYEDEFDLIILDEADAFPYRDNDFLHRIVKKAGSKSCHWIELSATLSISIGTKKMTKTQIPTLSARYHRHALDGFTIEWMRGECFDRDVLSGWIKNHNTHPVMIFVPTINQGHELKRVLKKQGIYCDFTYSSDMSKTQKINHFRLNKLPVLITTTLLERGITIVDLQVVVMHANHEVYTTETLIQICGRVGRHPDFPSGDILFMTHELTDSIHRARRYISRKNQEAIQKGLIDYAMPTVR
jgi:competence protein ComFA